ncbi:MAG: NAD-dependent succinate-semialdehyde dehydrogenase [Candidatus Dormibacteria bacterium]
MTDAARGAPVASLASAAAEVAVVSAVPKQLRIGSAWLDSEAHAALAVEDPSTGETLADVADASPADGIAALDAAHRAQQAWARTAPRTRSEILRRGYEALTAAAPQLALLITLEMGKPLADSLWEVGYAAEFFRWYAEETVRADGTYSPSPAGAGRILTMRQPVGPALLITPWNLPLAMATRKLGAALAAGCTTILKPAEQTPLTALALTEIMLASGVPDGVVNTVNTSEPAALVAALMADSRLRKVSFTGSTDVGRLLISQSAAQILRISLELGGNAPFLVFEDADLPAAVEGAVLAKMRTNGEACTAANRLYVDHRVAEEFTERLAARLAGMRVGRGTEPDVETGPLIDEAATCHLDGLVRDAESRGARAVTGGNRVQRAGHFFEPTLLSGVSADARMLHEEIFGPVAPVVSFRDDEEALGAANNTQYGLAAYVYTRDLGRALRVAERLECGMVALNQGTVANAAAPFGGIKHSGFGREGGREGIGDYLSTKYVAISLPD